MPLVYDRTKGDAATIETHQTATAEMAIPDFSGKRAEFQRSFGLGYFYTSDGAQNYETICKNIHYINNLRGGGCAASLGLFSLNSSLLTGKITGKIDKI